MFEQIIKISLTIDRQIKPIHKSIRSTRAYTSSLHDARNKRIIIEIETCPSNIGPTDFGNRLVSQRFYGGNEECHGYTLGMGNIDDSQAMEAERFVCMKRECDT